ncbi:transcriptional repressor [Nocardia sp. NEAU-G5]|uniref:Transcriptional repressor n=1 Tax=Nocardia albiluteola TaxID=2842303 RepID=A0ABS6AQ10_9NOCA|nr:transcriptional repressor [Nocardia albiluteola]MBU3060097.1 transcriptional repressor [Nocardia albiluteola]
MSAPDCSSAERPPERCRTTVRQRVVLDVLRRNDRFRSAQQLHAELHSGATIRIGLTSVYRILHRLTEQHLVETQRAEDGEVLYRIRGGSEHHHNLLCRICGRAERFTHADLEYATEHIAVQHRYTDVSHHIDLYGTCPDCAVGSAGE